VIFQDGRLVTLFGACAVVGVRGTRVLLHLGLLWGHSPSAGGTQQVPAQPEEGHRHCHHGKNKTNQIYDPQSQYYHPYTSPHITLWYSTGTVRTTWFAEIKITL
jgi:hypothetical protein